MITEFVKRYLVIDHAFKKDDLIKYFLASLQNMKKDDKALYKLLVDLAKCLAITLVIDEATIAFRLPAASLIFLTEVEAKNAKQTLAIFSELTKQKEVIQSS